MGVQHGTFHVHGVCVEGAHAIAILLPHGTFHVLGVCFEGAHVNLRVKPVLTKLATCATQFLLTMCLTTAKQARSVILEFNNALHACVPMWRSQRAWGVTCTCVLM
jgi:hypothetical protein